jgi:hypothetical protein
MNIEILYGLAIFGACALIGIVILIFLILWQWLSDIIHRVKRQHQYKHRFDKKPLAACYCVDCGCYSKEDNRCSLSGMDRHVPDNWFCKNAVPDSTYYIRELAGEERI